MSTTQQAAEQLVSVESATVQLTRFRYEALKSLTIVTQDGVTINLNLGDHATDAGNQLLIEAAEQWYQFMWEVLWEIAETEGKNHLRIVQEIRARKS